MEKLRIILAGGSGFLGQVLAKEFAAKNYEVIILSRSPRPTAGAIRFVEWDGKTIGAWAKHLDGATAVVNLTGRTVDCRYTAKNRKEILESRVDSTRVVGQAIAQC